MKKLLISLLLMFVCSTSFAVTQNIGYDSIGGSAVGYAGIGGLTFGSASLDVTAPSSGTCSKVFIYLGGTHTTEMEVGVYDSSYNLLGSGGTSTGTGWVEVAISPSVNIVQGNDYYVAFVSSATTDGDVYYQDIGETVTSREAYSTLPDPWVNANTRTYVFSMYLQYEVSSSTRRIITIQ